MSDALPRLGSPRRAPTIPPELEPAWAELVAAFQLLRGRPGQILLQIDQCPGKPLSVRTTVHSNGGARRR